MNKCQAICEEVDNSMSRFDAAIEWMLVALLAFMPFAFGVVHAWSEQVVIAVSGAVVVCFLLKLVFHYKQRVVWTWAYVPIGAFILVCVLQLIPLPADLLSVISPNTVSLKTELLCDLPDAQIQLSSMSLSFYSNATKHDLRLLLSVAAVFVVVLNVFRQPAQIKRLLTAIAIIGGLVSVIAVAQDFSGSEKIYWFMDTPYEKANSGPFINHNNYGQFINLSIGAALGLLIFKLNEFFCFKKKTATAFLKYLTSGSAKSFWLLAAVIIFGAASIFISLTRGGMVSLLIAAAFTTLLVAYRGSLKKQGWIMAVMALIAFICVLYMGFDKVYDRLASLRDFDKAQAFRLQILKDIAVAWKKFPILGAGMGTHAVVYPMFDRSTITALAAYAENEYAQAIEEAGIVGLGLLIIFGVIIWAKYVKCIRDTELPLYSLAYGLGFGLLAILIHSFSDFGQHLPANAVLSAIFCALLLELARHKDKRLIPVTRITEENIETFRTRFVIRGLVLVSASVIWIWCLAGANSARASESLWKNVHNIEKSLAERGWQGSSDEFKDLISGAARASACEPENVKHLYWLNVYRWHSISQTTDPDRGKTIISEQSMPIVYDIVDQLNKARAICPTYGPTYSVLGQIEKFILNDDTGAERIRKGFHLAPCDPIACFVAAYLDASEGKSEDCVEKFKRAVQLDYRLFKSAVNICVNQFSHPHSAMLIAGDNFGWLIYVAEALEDMQYKDLAEHTWEKAREILEVKCSEPDATAAMLASLGNIYRKQHNNGAAIKYYRRALALDYGQVHWRLTLAKLLEEKRQIPEAICEARICLRLRPQFEAAENLLAELSVNSAAIDEEIKSPDEL
jgi:hypothetical protein